MSVIKAISFSTSYESDQKEECPICTLIGFLQVPQDLLTNGDDQLVHTLGSKNKERWGSRLRDPILQVWAEGELKKCCITSKSRVCPSLQDRVRGPLQVDGFRVTGLRLTEFALPWVRISCVELTVFQLYFSCNRGHPVTSLTTPVREKMAAMWIDPYERMTLDGQGGVLITAS